MSDLASSPASLLVAPSETEELRGSEPELLADDPLQGTPYAAQSVLGRGSMGIVFLAKHRALGTDLVVKVLLQELAQYPDLVERMRVEAQTLARLRSPHIVTCSDFGATAQGTPYLVTEYLRGQTLAEVLEKSGRLSVLEAVDLTIQILRGLAVAHGEGIVHRDVKPANLFLTTNDGAEPLLKVLDFGVAKVMNNLACVAPSAFRTATGSLVGTPRYCSPEQAMGKELDGRSDLYSTALVFSALLTGRMPFQEKRGVGDILIAQAREVPPLPSTFAPGVPTEIDAVVAKALQKEPAARYGSAEEFIVALEAAATRLSTNKLEASLRASGNDSRETLPEDHDTEPFGDAVTQPGPQVGEAKRESTPLFLAPEARQLSAADSPTLARSRFQDSSTLPVDVPPVGFPSPSVGVPDQGFEARVATDEGIVGAPRRPVTTLRLIDVAPKPRPGSGPLLGPESRARPAPLLSDAGLVHRPVADAATRQPRAPKRDAPGHGLATDQTFWLLIAMASVLLAALAWLLIGRGR